MTTTTTTTRDGSGNIIIGGTTTTVVCCKNTVHPYIGAFVLGGESDGFAKVAGTLLNIAAGTLVKIVEGEEGEPEESTISTKTQTSTSFSSSSSSSSSSLSSSTASPSPYLVIPKDGTTSKQAEFESLLRDMATLSSVQAIMDETNNSVVFWEATLVENNATKVRNNPIVSLSLNSPCYISLFIIDS